MTIVYLSWERRRDRMKKKKPIIAILLISLIAAGSWWAWRYFLKNGVDQLQATGTIEATTVELNTRAAGVIKTLVVKAGDTVKKGQPVAELSRNDLVAQRERDQLSVLKAEIALNDLVSGARKQEITVAAAKAKIAQTNFSRAQDDLKRYETLAQSGAISQVELEKARAAAEISQDELTAAQASLSLLEAGSRPELINAAQAEVDRSKAVLKAAEVMLEDLKVASPIDGVVLSKNYEAGEYVQPGVSLVTIANLDDLWIKVYVPTDDLPRVKLGQQVQFTVSGYDRPFTGSVEEIASKGEFTPKTIQTKKERTNVVFAVKIRVDGSDGVLKPGLPADVTFIAGEES